MTDLVKKPVVKTLAKAKGRGSKAVAMHLSDDDTHFVGIGSLRVIISKDGKGWFAQGLEIDYGSGGKTIAKAKKNFEDGLRGTIKLHLDVHGGIKKLLQPAPQPVWKQLWGGRHYQHFQISRHDDIAKSLGFEAINYFEPRPEVTA